MQRLPFLRYPGRGAGRGRKRKKVAETKDCEKRRLKVGEEGVRRPPSPSTSTTTILSRSVTTVIAKGQKVFFCCPPPRSPFPPFAVRVPQDFFSFSSSASLPLWWSFFSCVPLFVLSRRGGGPFVSRVCFFLLRARDILSGINHSVADATQTEMGDGESDPPLSSHTKRPPDTININIDGAQLSLFHIR